MFVFVGFCLMNFLFSELCKVMWTMCTEADFFGNDRCSDPIMSKRRRTSSVASRGQDEESGEADTAPEPARKKKKLDPVSTDILLQGIFYLFVWQNRLCIR